MVTFLHVLPHQKAERSTELKIQNQDITSHHFILTLLPKLSGSDVGPLSAQGLHKGV